MLNVLPFTTSTRLLAAARRVAVGVAVSDVSLGFALPLDFTPPPRTAGPVEELMAKAVAVPPDVAEASVAVAPPVRVRPASCWETLNRTCAPAATSTAAPAASELNANDPASSRNRS